MKKALAILALGFAVLPFVASQASAHGCHRDPARDRFGWHRHAGPYCERVDVSPPRERYEHHHHDHDDGPRCTSVKRCHYVGPFKECKWVQECR